jgi:sulfur relay (sulfurtransferase) complex TusBCD TusD component (DsrE family)
MAYPLRVSRRIVDTVKVLFVLNDPAYGTERCSNAVRLAGALDGREHEVRVFLMGDTVKCPMSEQRFLRATTTWIG